MLEDDDDLSKLMEGHNSMLYIFEEGKKADPAPTTEPPRFTGVRFNS
jgi:hypothetical protein